MNSRSMKLLGGASSMNLQVKTRTKPIRWVKKIQKRDGAVATFSSDRITNAIYRAMPSTGEGSLEKTKVN